MPRSRALSLSGKLREYYLLCKPGIIRGNVFVAGAAFLFGSHGDVDAVAFLALIIGTSCIIASACTINNIFDRKIDAAMKRTQNRAIVVGSISPKQAALFAVVLFLVGSAVLLLWTNVLTFAVGLFGFIAYTAIYTPAKKRTHHATLLGTLSGSTPPVAGYVAATNSLDATALLLFVVLALWQMGHFFAIAIYRKDEYKAAHVPVLSLKRGIPATKLQIVLYSVGFLWAAALLGTVSSAGVIYAIPVFLASVWWLIVQIRGYNTKAAERWAGSVFGTSLLVLMVWSISLAAAGFIA